MDIGTKIKNARATAGLNQEQVAESLGVSRQTVSNWENGKTYPDIVSVVKMSDLYGISLDDLLKKENIEYLSYLHESTDAVKSNERKSKTILLAVYLAVWAASILIFWLKPNGFAMEYSIVFQVIVLPAVTVAVEVIIALRGYFGKLKWLTVPALGIMYMLADYGTFRLANMMAFGKFIFPYIGMLLIGSAIALAGLLTGFLVYKVKNKT